MKLFRCVPSCEIVSVDERESKYKFIDSFDHGFFRKYLIIVIIPPLLQTVTTTIAVGSPVWVEDSEAAWVDGDVTEVNGAEITVLCSSGKTVSTLRDVL